MGTADGAGVLPGLVDLIATVRRQAGRRRSRVDALDFVAHELRAPLAVMKGYISMLEDGTFPVPAQTRDGAVAILAAKAEELTSLIDVLHMAAQLAGGRLPVRASDFDIADAVRDAVAEVSDRARLEWATIDATLPESPVQVTADRAHVTRIVVNLLHNALTYSERPATVTIAVRRHEAAEVVVRDRGIGIAAERQREVFERFRRLDMARPEFTSGLGLGLPISRELAELNRGSLTLNHSEPGRGSVFVLRLPVRGR